MTQDNAFDFVINYLKGYLKTPSSYTNSYRFDLYLPVCIDRYISEEMGFTVNNSHAIKPKVSVVFYEVCWELCRRGILLPGWNQHVLTVGQSYANDGYCITSFGKHFLENEAKYTLLSTEPTRFAKTLEPYEAKFKVGFYQRSMEAVACYNSNNFLACCVMCGGAAESILLNLAIEKEGDEAKVLKEYKKSAGRKWIEDKILYDKKTYVKIQISAFIASSIIALATGHETLFAAWLPVGTAFIFISMSHNKK